MTTSSTASTDDKSRPDRPPVFVDAGQLGEDLTALVLDATDLANDRYAPGTELWLAREPEAAGLGRPAARIVKRHMPPGFGGTGNPDADDAVSAAITLFRYLWRQLRVWHQLRRDRAAGADPTGADEPVTVVHPPAPADPFAAV